MKRFALEIVKVLSLAALMGAVMGWLAGAIQTTLKPQPEPLPRISWQDVGPREGAEE